MTTISAQVVLASRHAQTSKTLWTILWRYPRWIHAEVMTHRMLSRNAASSRAIPVKRLIQDVRENPAIPMFWGANQKGMQADAECNNPVLWPNKVSANLRFREQAWLLARDNAVQAARAFDAAGYHKQIVNRLLEPFAHITVLVSATEWENFFALRDHESAEPHIRLLAQRTRAEMQRALDAGEVKTLQPGEWHLPFARGDIWPFEDLRKLSVARCASTSYKTVDGFDMTLDRATRLHGDLLAKSPVHASPAEHVAQADEWIDHESAGFGPAAYAHAHQHGNFIGFRQYRKMLPNEYVRG